MADSPTNDDPQTEPTPEGRPGFGEQLLAAVARDTPAFGGTRQLGDKTEEK